MENDTDLLTWEQARARTAVSRTEAVESALAQFLSGTALAAATAQAIAAYESAESFYTSDCPDIDPKWGQCIREFGHEGTHYTTEHDDPRRPDGSHPWDY